LDYFFGNFFITARSLLRFRFFLHYGDGYVVLFLVAGPSESDEASQSQLLSTKETAIS
jgi:hypothetical protein